MLTFECDYNEGAHEKILRKLMETNLEQHPGYRMDSYCQSAKEKIRKACENVEAQVEFLVGGTQTNQIVIASILRNYEGVLSTDCGHINVHESGAIEYSGHKVLVLPSHQGKMDARELKDWLVRFYNDGTCEHMVQPGMVYLTHPTEYGTLYTREEFLAIREVCDEYHLPMFVDGARLGYGLGAEGTDVDLPFLAHTADVFYIGGTKCGALCGEAVVFTHNNMPKHFLTTTKQHGGLLAKGRLLGIQFDVLFTDDLYFEITRQADVLAYKLRDGFKAKGYKMLMESNTNQQFPILENSKLEELSKNVGFSIWEPVDETHTAVRFATSWATTKENVETLLEMI